MRTAAAKRMLRGSLRMAAALLLFCCCVVAFVSCCFLLYATRNRSSHFEVSHALGWTWHTDRTVWTVGVFNGTVSLNVIRTYSPPEHPDAGRVLGGILLPDRELRFFTPTVKPDVLLSGGGWGMKDRFGFMFLDQYFGPIEPFSFRTWTVVCPMWFVLMTVGGLGVWLGWWMRQHRRWKPGYCPACGYDLRATPGRCPECGREVVGVVAKVKGRGGAN